LALRLRMTASADDGPSAFTTRRGRGEIPADSAPTSQSREQPAIDPHIIQIECQRLPEVPNRSM